MEKKIYTFDSDNIYAGTLKVQNREYLSEICHELLKDSGKVKNYRIIKSESLGGINSLISKNPSRVGDRLVYRDIINTYDNDECEYIKRKVEHLRLNSVLLFISLLCELDATYYDSYAKDFVRSGIINCKPFDQIWDRCSSNMVNKILNEIKNQELGMVNDKIKNARLNLQKLDLVAFRAVLNEGIISYEKEKVNISGHFIGGTTKGLQQLNVNNTVLLGTDDIFAKVRVKK